MSADGLQDNAQHIKRPGIKTAICGPSIRPNLCISSRGRSVAYRRVSLTSFRGCDPDIANSAGSGRLPPRPPLRLQRWLEGKTQLSQEGISAYRFFRHVIILHKVQRQLATEDGDEAQKLFLELLPRARDGCLTEDDWRLLLTRAPHLQTEEEMGSFQNVTRLFYSKAEVKWHNGAKLRELDASVLKVEARHSSASA